MKIRLRKKVVGLLKGGLIVLLLATGGRTALAETWKGMELRRAWEEAAWKLGPFRVQPYLFLRNAGYDSNVYHQPEPVPDYWFTVGPGFDVYLPVKKKLLFQAYVSPQYVYFKETTRERTWNHYFNSRVHLLFNKFLVSAGFGLSDARERWDTEIDIRPRRKEESIFASVLWQKSKKTSFAVSTRRARYDYESIEFYRFNLRDRLNRDEIYVTATAFYQMTYRMRGFVEGEYGYFDFENPLSRRDAESRAVYGGFEFSPFGRIRGRLRLGYKELMPLDEGMADYKGLVGDTSVSILFLRNLAVRGAYRRDVRFSLWYENPYYLENWAGGGVSVYLFRRKVRADWDYNEGKNEYPVSGMQGGGDGEQSVESREDRFLVRSVGLYFRLKDNVGIGLTAGRWDRDVNVLGWSVRREFVNLNLTYEF